MKPRSPSQTRLRRFALAALLTAASARAHDPGLSTLELRLDGEDLVAREIFVAAELPDDSGPRDWKQIARDALEMRLDGRLVAPEGVEAQVAEEGEARLVMLFNRGGARQLRLRSMLLPRLGRNHRQYVTLVSETGALLTNKLLSAADPEFSAELPAPPAAVPPATAPAPTPTATPAAVGASPSFAGFFRLGVEHILTGYDHLLFLFGLLVVGAALWPAVRIITSFTIAHSITLALATFHVVSLPSRVVEPLIAATIVYVGIENLWRRDLRHRWVLTFFFGLVHGLGFASALRQVGVGETTGIAVPLVAFNLGVEFGQIAVAAGLLPLIWRLSRWPTYSTWLAPAGSLAVTAAGAYWLWQRAILR